MPRPRSSELTNRGQYKPELIEYALTVYAIEGNGNRAEKAVKDKFGAGPGGGSIIKWATDTHNELFLRIREDVAEKIKARVATDVEDLLRESLEVQAKALRKVNIDLDALEARDSPGALRNVATSAAILADKLHQMRGDNTIHVEHTLNADELLAKLGALFGGGVAPSIDSTAIAEPAHIAQGSGQVDASEPVSGA